MDKSWVLVIPLFYSISVINVYFHKYKLIQTNPLLLTIGSLGYVFAFLCCYSSALGLVFGYLWYSGDHLPYWGIMIIASLIGQIVIAPVFTNLRILSPNDYGSHHTPLLYRNYSQYIHFKNAAWYVWNTMANKSEDEQGFFIDNMNPVLIPDKRKTALTAGEITALAERKFSSSKKEEKEEIKKFDTLLVNAHYSDALRKKIIRYYEDNCEDKWLFLTNEDQKHHGGYKRVPFFKAFMLLTVAPFIIVPIINGTGIFSFFLFKIINFPIEVIYGPWIHNKNLSDLLTVTALSMAFHWKFNLTVKKYILAAFVSAAGIVALYHNLFVVLPAESNFASTYTQALIATIREFYRQFDIIERFGFNEIKELILNIENFLNFMQGISNTAIAISMSLLWGVLSFMTVRGILFTEEGNVTFAKRLKRERN